MCILLYCMYLNKLVLWLDFIFFLLSLNTLIVYVLTQVSFSEASEGMRPQGDPGVKTRYSEYIFNCGQQVYILDHFRHLQQSILFVCVAFLSLTLVDKLFIWTGQGRLIIVYVSA